MTDEGNGVKAEVAIPSPTANTEMITHLAIRHGQDNSTGQPPADDKANPTPLAQFITNPRPYADFRGWPAPLFSGRDELEPGESWWISTQFTPSPAVTERAWFLTVDPDPRATGPELANVPRAAGFEVDSTPVLGWLVRHQLTAGVPVPTDSEVLPAVRNPEGDGLITPREASGGNTAYLGTWPEGEQPSPELVSQHIGYMRALIAA